MAWFSSCDRELSCSTRFISRYVIRQKKFFDDHLCILDIYKIGKMMYNVHAPKGGPQSGFQIPPSTTVIVYFAEYQTYDINTQKCSRRCAFFMPCFQKCRGRQKSPAAVKVIDTIENYFLPFGSVTAVVPAVAVSS